MSAVTKKAENFIGTFTKALSQEISEIRSGKAHRVQVHLKEPDEESDSTHFTSIGGPQSLGISLPAEAQLVDDSGSFPITILEYIRGEFRCKLPPFFVDKIASSFRGTIEIDPAAPLVKLQLALTETLAVQHHNHSLALRLFANSPEGLSIQTKNPCDLNPGQQAAIHTACTQSVSFIWGPPGTGKSKTLASLAEHLLDQGERVCITTTTNAAVDALLTHCLQRPALKDIAEADGILRMGAAQSPYASLSLSSLNERRTKSLSKSLKKLRSFRRSWKTQRKALLLLHDQLTEQEDARQVSLFASQEQSHVSLSQYQKAFPRAMRSKLPEGNLLDAPHYKARLRRLNTLIQQSSDRLNHLQQQYHQQRSSVIGDARLIVSTLSALTYYDELREQSVDSVIIDEAGMVTPPAAYLAATLGQKRVVIAGDPRQLPPVVHSQAHFVQQVLARDLFHIAPKVMMGADNCTQLSIQYRMPPRIGGLVSDLFYDSRLTAAKKDSSDARLVYLDMSGQSKAEQTPERSRINTASHDVVMSLLQTLSEESLQGAIIAPYKAQARLYYNSVRQAGLSDDWECATVHRFQGKEKPVIILDLVDAAPLRPGILLRDKDPDSTAARLLNVSISRASKCLYIVADFSYFQSSIPQSITSRLLGMTRERGQSYSTDAFQAA